MQIKELSDKSLLTHTLHARREEKTKIHAVLLHLKEILTRKLFADLNYGSLHEYCMRELNYTSGEAAYRVSAVKLMRESKKIEAKLESGELNLSGAVLVHNHFSHAEKKPTKKQLEDTVEKISGKTKSQTKEILAGEKKTHYASIMDSARKKVSAKQGCLDLLAELLSYSEAHEVQEILREQIKLKKAKLEKVSAKKSDPKNSRYIPRALKAKVRGRAQGKCEHPGCTRRDSLEFEHIIPYAMGGMNTDRNLTLFCRLHNQRAAVKSYGVPKMQAFEFHLCE